LLDGGLSPQEVARHLREVTPTRPGQSSEPDDDIEDSSFVAA
jgi:hypothetical protein